MSEKQEDIGSNIECNGVMRLSYNLHALNERLSVGIHRCLRDYTTMGSFCPEAIATWHLRAVSTEETLKNLLSVRCLSSHPQATVRLK